MHTASEPGRSSAVEAHGSYPDGSRSTPGAVCLDIEDPAPVLLDRIRAERKATVTHPG